jgi:hypothetical protein
MISEEASESTLILVESSMKSQEPGPAEIQNEAENQNFSLYL